MKIMVKSIIKLTEEQFKNIVKESVNESILEFEDKTSAWTPNSPIKDQQDHLQSILGSNFSKIDLDYRDNYTFHCTNLRGAASLLVFTLEQLYSLHQNKAILKGMITFNGEQMSGSVIVDVNTKNVSYNYKGMKPTYSLTIDPSKKQKWNQLINQFDLSLK